MQKWAIGVFASVDAGLGVHLDVAKELGIHTVQVHTPHRDKKRGTIRSMDVCEEHGLDPSKVIIDHNNEETVREVLDRGYWAAFTIYPKTKMGNERMEFYSIRTHYECASGSSAQQMKLQGEPR